LAVALPPLKTVEDLNAARLLADLQSAAVAAGVTGRAAGLSMRDVYRERFDRQAIHPWPAGARLRRTYQRPAFLGGPLQPRAGDVPAVGIEFRGPWQAALGLRLQRLIQARLISLGGLLRDDRHHKGGLILLR
jgi:hypothetical protein